MQQTKETSAAAAALHAGMPPTPLNVYARWWQLETYLREMVYTELRAAYGLGWLEHLGQRTTVRAARDRVNAYMASADSEELLTYADVTGLFDLIASERRLFDPLLPPQSRWQGYAEELAAIRNRIAHCRRPHPDDLGRVEQALRNLEPGARSFYSAYCDASPISPKSGDPLARAWVAQRHDAAARLVEHRRRKYGVQFRLEYSVRPWAPKSADRNSPSAAEGILWHAKWVLAEEVEPVYIWGKLNAELRELLVHLIFSGVSVEATFSAADPHAQIADAIGTLFDRLVPAAQVSRRRPETDFEELQQQHRADSERLPVKAQIGGIFSYFDPYESERFSIFGA